MRIVSRIKTLLLAAGIAGVFSIFSGSVMAHSSLTASLPGDGVTVASPARLELTFNENVRVLRVDLVHGASHQIDFGFQPTTAAATTVSYDLPALMVGGHTVNWTVIGTDGHPVNGTFTFTVSPDGEAATSQSHGGAGHHHH